MPCATVLNMATEERFTEADVGALAGTPNLARLAQAHHRARATRTREAAERLERSFRCRSFGCRADAFAGVSADRRRAGGSRAGPAVG